ncbi:MAG: hypothetical protein J6B92_04545 [Paraprevotella sp.]|nr:hypothetical protein [Paraprevotella sp.]MBP3470708.1 hypothetical protein [Paraprevotella sp.]
MRKIFPNKAKVIKIPCLTISAFRMVLFYILGTYNLLQTILSNFTPQLGEQISPSQKQAKQIAPQAGEREKESLHRPKTCKTNCSTGCGVGKRIAPQAKNVQNKLLHKLKS